MTGEQLYQAIQDYTQNYEQTFVANIPLFIQQTEDRVYNNVMIPAVRKNVTATINQGYQYLNCPSDFLSVFSMGVFNQNTGTLLTYLLDKDVNFLREAYPPNPDDTASWGLPKYYALFGPTMVANNVGALIPTNNLSFILAPAPDDFYNVELHYYYYPESITTGDSYTNGTWLSLNYSPVLLYGSLVEAYTFMKGEQDMMAYYEKKYQDALGQLIRLSGALERGDAYRDGQYKGKAAP